MKTRRSQEVGSCKSPLADLSQDNGNQSVAELSTFVCLDATVLEANEAFTGT